jgi:hypothetical protein
MQGIQNLIGQLVTRAWFQAGLPMNITNDMPKSNLIVPNGGKDV